MVETYVADTVRKRWIEVLEAPQADGGDDFFLCGGHSLLAVRLATALREDFGVRVPVSMLFRTRKLDSYIQQVQDLVQPSA